MALAIGAWRERRERSLPIPASSSVSDAELRSERKGYRSSASKPLIPRSVLNSELIYFTAFNRRPW